MAELLQKIYQKNKEEIPDEKAGKARRKEDEPGKSDEGRNQEHREKLPAIPASPSGLSLIHI